MISDWNLLSPDLQLSLSHAALGRVRHLIGAQAEILAERMEVGTLPSLDGPDALRLLAMMLGDHVSGGEPAQWRPGASRLQTRGSSALRV